MRALLASNTTLLTALKELAFPAQEVPADDSASDVGTPEHAAASWRDFPAGQQWRYSPLHARSFLRVLHCEEIVDAFEMAEVAQQAVQRHRQQVTGSRTRAGQALCTGDLQPC